MFRRVVATTAAAVCLLAFASVIVPSCALSCGVESQNCPALAYCENITVNGVYQPTCVCPPGTIGSEDYTSNNPPFTSGPTCNKDLWTVRYVKKHSAWGEWRVCGASQTNGNGNHGTFTCNQCVGELRYGRDDTTVANYPGPWWTYKAAPTTNSISACTKAQFGIASAPDPYPNEYKSCDCRKLVELPFSQWTKCAEEHGACTCAGTVRYGSDTAWRDITSDGNSPVACDNNRNGWGDPHVGTYKACYCFTGVYQTLIPGWNRTLSENPSAVVSADAGFGMCEVDSKGYYLRMVGDTLEVNCLYDNKTKAEQEVGAYSDPTYTVAPRVYRWVLPTTAEPIEIPPTGVTVDSVSFDTTCAASGCWVIKGTMTTGEAFNDFSVFNTFFLPQATVPNRSISYDFDYSATGSNVDWTFQPANHPCSSGDYKAGVTPNIFKISYCCISEPTVTPTNVPNQKGGFVANYRPTQNFVNWADQHSKACDLQFTTADGGFKCWKKFSDAVDTADQASARCIVAGGTLPTIANETENTLFRQLFTSGKLSGTSWLGLKDSLQETGNSPATAGPSANWKWADGSTSAYRNWAGGEPNNYLYRGAFGEDCVEFVGSNGKWNDESCGSHTKLYKYVCQFTDEQACRKTVIQRPKYSAPPQMAAPCWKVVRQAMNYMSAQASCVAMGGNLALVDSPEKFHLMKRMLDVSAMNVQEAWIGLDDMENERVFKWIISGETMTDPGDALGAGASYFQGWRTDCHHTSCGNNAGRGYPNSWADNANWRSQYGTADCVAVTDQGRWWQDFLCNETKAFVCEVPRPSDEDDLGQCNSFLPNLDTMWNMPFPVNYNSFMFGKFKGMPVSPGVVSFVNLDPYFGQFSFEVRLDEVELRSKAGQLRGTVGVEHTVDTFLGLSSFRPTGLANGVLDTFSTQTNLHLEKTSFFTVSTHGVNDYTFLEYVNMRLISVYTEDKNFTGNNNAVTERTSSAGNLNYVQVTFTIGAAYTVNNNPNADPYASGLIPLNSVRTGQGTFLTDVESAGGLQHTCQEYEGADDTDDIGLMVGRVEKKTFDDGIAQSCGPQSTMCASPASVPDQFVSFNIPLGSEVFDDQADSTLSNNVFVSLVVNALKPSSSMPNSGGEPQQMKTTLTASIPIVAGGINIFCDGVTAKTDLKDVADVDIIVGSASSGAELTRLRIMQNIGSTDLSTVEPSEIDTDSIESALMTLVLKGNHSYFKDGNTNTLSYTMELDDVITLHLMEDGAATSTNSKETEVLRLLAMAGDDNSDVGTGTLDTDGYALNGAFYFTIDRAANKAHLEPSEALLDVCPVNPPRPASGSAPLETCILRRDVKNRGYPNRVGASRTAMEVLAASGPSRDSEKSDIDSRANDLLTSSAESTFLAGILGNSEYSKDLAVQFAKAIHERYELNGRYRRAYWINPGYEWTPTQTAGKSIFSVSQKLYLFALISLDENWQRRRALLQSSTDALAGSSAGVNGAAFSFQISPKSMLADAYQVPEDRVAVFDVEVVLTQTEACMPLTDLQAELRDSLGDILATTASAYHSVQVTRLERNLNGMVCPSRRALRKLLASEALSQATAAAQMLVVFVDTEGKPRFNHVAFDSSPRIAGFAPDQSNTVDYDANFVCKDGECGPKTSNSAPSAGADDDEEGSGSKTAIIAGVAGGVGGALLAAAGAVFFMKQRKPDAPIAAVQSINVAELKSQLSHDV